MTTDSATATQSVNTSYSPSIKGTLEAVSAQTVATLHANFQHSIQAVVDKALPADADADLKKVAFDYCIARAKMRMETTPKFLSNEMGLGRAGIIELTTRHNEQHDAVIGEMNSQKQWRVQQGTPESRERIKTELDKVFGDEERLYFNLKDESKSPVEPFVRAYLEKRHYVDIDYKAGYATDPRKNKVKIGKILADNPPLLDGYREDFTRMGGNLMVVVSRKCEDLVRASFGRGWRSCRADTHAAASNGLNENEQGVLAVYLIRASDPDILDPLGRINIKPYDQRTGSRHEFDTVYMGFNPIGLHHPGFIDAVNNFVDVTFNEGKYGKFGLRDGCEAYREMKTRHRLPQDAEAALMQLEVPYLKRADGKIIVPGDFSLKDLGLYRLPDFTAIAAKGGIDVSGNKIVSLEGLPREPLVFLTARSTLISAFNGAPAVTRNMFDYRNNPYLMSTDGAPKASYYCYGNDGDFHSSAKHKEGEVCVGPLDQPALFPGFRRK